ncbi:thioredoxin family protein [Candidatus Nomurabacteria bacterium]|nr:thioredoxin family protein [Candidatus Nomurabacteria bacterium]
MNNKIKWIIGSIAIGVVLVTAVFIFSNKDRDIQPSDSAVGISSQSESEAMQEQEEQEESVQAQVDSSDQQSVGQSSLEAESGYIDYDPAQLARADNGDVVLFFHAGWCPTCKILDQSLTNTDFLSTGITVMKLDYDSETELKNQYGVTSQHTLVQVDSQGNLIKSWRGSYNLSQIEQELAS